MLLSNYDPHEVRSRLSVHEAGHPNTSLLVVRFCFATLRVFGLSLYHAIMRGLGLTGATLSGYCASQHHQERVFPGQD